MSDINQYIIAIQICARATKKGNIGTVTCLQTGVNLSILLHSNQQLQFHKIMEIC